MPSRGRKRQPHAASTPTVLSSAKPRDMYVVVDAAGKPVDGSALCRVHFCHQRYRDDAVESARHQGGEGRMRQAVGVACRVCGYPRVSQQPTNQEG